MRSKRRSSRKRINGRKKRTLKFRGGDLDDPDTKDFMNSKIEALEQKITELEANTPVQIGYKALRMAGGDLYGLPTNMPLFVKKNISVEDFWKYVGKGSDRQQMRSFTTIFLPALYSLPNVRGLNINDCVYSFDTGNIADNSLVSKRNLEALDEKYPGLFTQ